jgi:hypothetical protein
MGKNRENMTPTEMVAAVRGEHADRRQVRSERATKTKKLPDVIACWQRAFLAQGFDDERYSTPIRKDVGIFLRHYGRYGGKRNMQEMLMAICDRWDALRFGPMSWHDGFPPRPNFHFIAHHLRFFIDSIDKLSRTVDGTKSVEDNKRSRRSWKDVKSVD